MQEIYCENFIALTASLGSKMLPTNIQKTIAKLDARYRAKRYILNTHSFGSHRFVQNN